MPSLRALQAFAAVLDAGSVSAAARLMHLTQPSLSHHLAALEQDLGARVLDRSAGGVRPTALGRAIEADARAAVAAFDRVRSIGRAAARGEAGTLRVACAESLTVPVVAPVLRRWRTERPDASVELDELSSGQQIVERLRSGRADLALSPTASGWAGPAAQFATEEVLVVLPDRSHLAHHSRIAFHDLDAAPFVHYDAENGLAAWVDGLFAHAGARPSVVARTRHATTAAELAASGLGAAVVPATAVPSGMDARVRSMDPPLTRELLVLWSTDQPLVTAFRSALIEVSDRHGLRSASTE